MTAERAREILDDAEERWGYSGSLTRFGESWSMLIPVRSNSKPDAVLGPLLTDAALRIARGLREEVAA